MFFNLHSDAQSTWASLTNNGWISREALQNAVNNGIFTLKSGQTIPSTDIKKWVSVSEVLTWCNLTINSSPIVTTNNQWPQKSWLIATASCPSGAVPAFATTDRYPHDFNNFPDCFYFNSSNQRYYTDAAFTTLASGYVYSDADSAVWRQLPAISPDRTNHVNNTYNHFFPFLYSSFHYLGDGACSYSYNTVPHSDTPPGYDFFVQKSQTYEFTIKISSMGTGNVNPEFAVVLYQGAGSDPATDQLVFTSPFYIANTTSTYTFQYTTTSTQFQIMQIAIIGKDGLYCNNQAFNFTFFYKQL